MFFSKERGFVDPRIHGNVDGCVEVPDDFYVQLLEGQALGKSIEIDESGSVYLKAAPAPSWEECRAKRNQLLSESDWTQLPDNVLSAEKKAAWAAYRGELRNLPETYPDAAVIVWPQPPV